MKLWLITLFLQSINAARNAWRADTKVFPYKVFPAPSLIDNGDNDGGFIEENIPPAPAQNATKECIKVWIGNGACNHENNNLDCDWDGGDCCRKTCETNCLTKFQKGEEPCKYECGSFFGFQCKQPNAGCSMCGPQGVCLSQDKCIDGSVGLPTVNTIQNMIATCKSISWSQGDLKTINEFCGKDPTLTVIHDPFYPLLHFPGCGLFQYQCTLYPVCYDVRTNNVTQFNCDTAVKQFTLYDPASKGWSQLNTDCISYFTNAVLKNYQYYGQCCQCNQGWTGIDCNTAICFPTCINGDCIGPNTCACLPGWTGLICHIGICELCKYGICTGPEQCECFYGYKGHSCDIPVSYPPCLNGNTTQPDYCLCDEGWTGRICDMAVCDPPCGPKGHCINPNVCECDIGWLSSDISSPCDIQDPLMFDHNCVEAYTDLKSGQAYCTQCDYQFYLNPVDNLCYKCNQIYDHMCIECDYEQCLECQWPFKVDPATAQCVTGGVIEFSNTYLDVVEDQQFFWLILRRSYGINGTVSVNYDMTMTEPLFTRIEYQHGTVVFDDQVETVALQFKVYKRFYFETGVPDSLYETQDTVFTVYLEYPSGGAEIGYRNKVTIHYFDSQNMTTVNWTYALFQGYSPKQTSQNLFWKPQLILGQVYDVFIYSNYFQNLPKTNGHDVYYLVCRSTDRKILREIFKSSWVTTNQHIASFPAYDRDLKFIHVFASTPGYTAKYYLNPQFQGKPFIERVDNNLPDALTQNELKQYNMISLNFTFVAEFPKIPKFPMFELVTFTLHLAENSLAQVLLNSTLIFDVPLQSCPGQYRQSFNSSVSCCKNGYQFSRNLSSQVTYHFEINYVQRQQAWNGPCIQFTRSSQNMDLDSIDNEAVAIWELEDSPFQVTPVLTPFFISAIHSDFYYHPRINKNTRQLVSQSDFQLCVANKFSVQIRDWFKRDIPDDLRINITFTLQIDANTTIQSKTLIQLNRSNLV